MITEAIIVEINHNYPYCTIEIPLFRTANSKNRVYLKASFAITPGIYNGYVLGDKVWVGFENNRVDRPVIFGKVYEGPEAESSVGHGAIFCDSLTVKNNISIPMTTKLNFNANSFSESVLAPTATDINVLIGKISALESEVETLQNKIDELTNN